METQKTIKKNRGVCFPDEIYEAVWKLAIEENRTFQKEVVTLLNEALTARGIK